MKKSILTCMLFCLPLWGLSQILKERRVYYLDCSYSMVNPNKIWEKVCDNLKTAIDNVADETTELIVIPFALDNRHHISLNAYKELATPEGKAKLKKIINGIKPSPASMTYHSDEIKDFYNCRVAPDRVNYMFFMTDGQNEEKPDPMPGLINQWREQFGGKNVFGFYVMLCPAANNENVEKIINNQPQIWNVKTANVNINLIRLQSSAIFNAKNDKYFDLPLYGDVSGKTFSAAFPANCPYKVKNVEKKSESLRIWVDTSPGHKLPVSTNYPLSVKMIGGKQFDFLVTEKVSIKCEYKPERSLKISVR